jgi:hypothetical protein
MDTIEYVFRILVHMNQNSLFGHANLCLTPDQQQKEAGRVSIHAMAMGGYEATATQARMRSAAMECVRIPGLGGQIKY